MPKTILCIILMVLISSFNLLVYADDRFTLLSLEAYNTQLDKMYNALKRLTEISDVYEIRLNRVQHILSETTDSATQTHLKQVIDKYQTYLNQVDNLKFNLDNNINALGEIARHTDQTTLSIRVPDNLIKVPTIPEPPSSLPILSEGLTIERPSAATGSGDRLRRELRDAAQRDQEAARLETGEKRLGRLGREAQRGAVRKRVREAAARRTQKITDDFFKDLREKAYQAQLEEWHIKYPPQHGPKLTSGIKNTFVSSGRIMGKILSFFNVPVLFYQVADMKMNQQNKAREQYEEYLDETYNLNEKIRNLKGEKELLERIRNNDQGLISQNRIDALSRDINNLRIKRDFLADKAIDFGIFYLEKYRERIGLVPGNLNE